MQQMDNYNWLLIDENSIRVGVLSTWKKKGKDRRLSPKTKSLVY